MKLPCGCEKGLPKWLALRLCLKLRCYGLFDWVHGKVPTLKGGQ